MAKPQKPGTVGNLPLPQIPLFTLMYAEFAAGKQWWLAAVGFELVALIAGLASTAVGDLPRVIFGAAIMALVASIVSVVCQRNAGRARALGEQTRRYLIYSNGLGWTPNPALEAILRRRYSRLAKRIARGLKHPPDPYYESTRPPGPERLLDHLQESVWWQAQLSARMNGYALGATVVVGLVFLIGVLLALSTFEDQSNRDIAAKVLSSVLLFLITSRVGFLWWDFHTQAVALEQMDNQLEALRKRGTPPNEEDVLQPAHEYDIALLDAPPVPDLVYRLNQDELNALWRDRRRGEPDQAPLM